MSTAVVERQLPAVALAWVTGLVMLTLATSVVGIVTAPVVVPAALYAASRRLPWAARVPLLLGAAALTLLVALWLLGGASTGTRTRVG
jgi:hypothetical protein